MQIGIGISISGLARRRGSSPAVLFAASEPGVWLDPLDAATVFSDTAGTTQAGIGDPVARINDKSGNGNHATQPTLASRPILREADGLRYLEFDGVDDWMFRDGVSGSQWTFAASAQTESASAGMFFGNRTASDDRFGVRFDQGTLSVGHFSGAWIGKVMSSPGAEPAVISALVDEGVSTVAFLNNTELTSTGAALSNTTSIFSIGAITAGNSHFQGRVFGIVLSGALVGEAVLADLRGFLASKAGVQL